MISVIIPTLNAERTLPLTLNALLEAHIDGLVREVIIADRGSTDVTARIADEAGATLLSFPNTTPQRAVVNAANDAKFNWVLVLEPGSAPERGFERAIANFIQNRTHNGDEAGFMKYASHSGGIKGFAADQVFALRTRAGFAPRSEQGLLAERRVLLRANLADANGSAALSQMLDTVRFVELNARIVVLGALKARDAVSDLRSDTVLQP